MTYATSVAAENKRPVYILEFPDHSSQRYINRRDFSPSPAADLGLELTSSIGSRLDINTGEISFDSVEVTIRDPDGTVATFLSTNDTTLWGATCLLKYGFDDLAESEFKTLRLLLHDWQRNGNGEFEITLRSAITFLDAPLFEDVEADSATLTAQLEKNGLSLQAGANLTDLEWPASGFLLLSNADTGEEELAEYSSFNVVSQDESTVTLTNRRKFNIGAVGKVWAADETTVAPAWGSDDDPISLFLRLATSTDVALTNGPDDSGDGDGLGDGVPYWMIDRQAFVDIRDSLFTDVTGAVRPGAYAETEAIASVIEYFEREFLGLGLYFGITADGRLTLRPILQIRETDTALSAKFDLQDGEVPWTRSYEEVENNVELSYGYNAADSGYTAVVSIQDSGSSDRYGKSKVRIIETRGVTGRAARAFGLPDNGWDAYMRDAACDYITALSNPSPLLQLPSFVELQDTEVGALLTLTHPGIFDLEGGAIGLTNALAYVVGIERRPEAGIVGLLARQLRSIGRDHYISPDFTVDTYRVNFTTSGGDAVDGYDNADSSTTYPTTGGVGGAGNIGWTTAPDSDIDNDDFRSPDERYDSLSERDNTSAESVFKVSLANGDYRVTVACGDQGAARRNTIKVSGDGGSTYTTLIDDISTVAGEFTKKTATVTVTSDLLVQVGKNDGGATLETGIAWLTVVGETTLDDYNNATAAEKQFAFISPDAGNFPDSGAPYDTGI